jgi:membrane protein implicated in regulation of membrane protease activity
MPLSGMVMWLLSGMVMAIGLVRGRSGFMMFRAAVLAALNFWVRVLFRFTMRFIVVVIPRMGTLLVAGRL